jgi:hypothetical protein
VYEVLVRKKAIKNVEKAPESVQILFDQLTQDLRDKGPLQTEWPITRNFQRKRTIAT